MTIDNFDIFREKLTFEKARKFNSKTGRMEEINNTYDRYIVQILKRAKDDGGKSMGVNTSNRLIKTYEISSLEYFDKKRAHIVDLCRSSKARAYILPQVRSTYDCLKEMLKIGVDNLENPTVKFQHILRSCMCSMHKSRNKMWILDLDSDCMTEYSNEPTFGGHVVKSKTWTPDEVLALVRKQLVAIGKSEDDCYVVPTKSGCHIVTSPFNLQAAAKECGLMYEGVKKAITGVTAKYLRPGDKGYTGSPGLDRKFEFEEKEIVGWLHKDGMSLLYYSDGE